MAARIKEVWFGIEHPDPTVDRKGIRHLQDNGVKVRLFDADFQQQNLTLTIYRSAEGLAHELVGPAAMAELNVAAVASWRVAAVWDSISTKELMASTGFDERKAQRAVKSLLDAGLLRTLGNGRSTRYTTA